MRRQLYQTSCHLVHQPFHSSLGPGFPRGYERSLVGSASSVAIPGRSNDELPIFLVEFPSRLGQSLRALFWEGHPRCSDVQGEAAKQKMGLPLEELKLLDDQ